MSGVGDLIFIIVLLAILAGLLIGFHKFLKSLYEWFASKIANRLVLPISWCFNKILSCFERLNNRIFKKSKHELMPSFGGIGRVILMALMLIASGLILYTVIPSTEDLHDFFLNDILLKTPPMYIISLFVEGKDGLNVFDIKNLVDIVLVSAFTIAFFHSNRELHIVVQIIYNLIFSLFFTLMPYFIPPVVYVLPAAVYGVFFDFMSGALDTLSMAKLGFFGLLLTILVAILFVVGMFISLYIIVTVIAVAIRELAASFVYSTFATIAVLISALIVEAIFGTSSGLWPEVILTIAVFGLTLGINAWRSNDDELLNTTYPDYMPWFARLFLRIKFKLAEAYRKNA